MRILLVDDDAGIVQALLAVLQTLSGHEIRTAVTGDEALAAAAEMGGLDLLITDVVMEPMDGFTLRDHVVAKYPGVRTILISGYDLSDYPEQTQAHQLLAKPIDAETLLTAVAREVPAAQEPEPQPAPQPAPVAEAVPEAAPVATPIPEPIAASAPEPEPVTAPVPIPEPTPVAASVPEPERAPVVAPVPEPEPAPVAASAPVPDPAPVAASIPEPEPTPVAASIPEPEPAPVAASIPEPEPTPVAASVPAPEPAPVTPSVPASEPAPVTAPVPVSEPAPVAASIPAPEPTPVAASVPVPVAAPIAEPAPASIPAAVPVAGPTRPVAVPVPRATAAPVAGIRPTVTVKAVPNPTAAPPPLPTPNAQTPTVRATAVPSLPTPRPSPTEKAGPPVPGAPPKAVPAKQPTVTVKATAVPRPSIVATPPGLTPPNKAGVPPGPSSAAQQTVRVSATVKAQPVPPPSVPGGPPAARPSSIAGPGGSVPGGKSAPTPGPPMRATAVPAPRSGAVQTKAVSAVGPQRPTAAPSTVVATPVSAPDGTTPTQSTPAPASADSGEDLSGRMLGAYQLLRKMGDGRWGHIYAGLQTSINRPVAIEVLDAVKAADPTSQARFVADARAKAAVQHPSILAVYEAGEAEGRFFYAYEYVDGQSIADLKAAGQRLDEPTALKVLRVAADGLSYFSVHHTPHAPPDSGSISLGADGHPRLANLATQLADETLAPPQEIQALGRVMLGVLPAIQSLSPGLREMLKRMVQPGPQALTSWGHLLQGIKSLEPKIVPTDAAKISAQDRAAIAAVEQARKQQKRSLYYNLASVATLLVMICVSIWYFVFRNGQRIYDEQIQIPAGEFIFANNIKKTLPDFWIDKYEVTYGQYATFVKALEERSTTEFDHPDQPRSKTGAMHKPPNWDIYYPNAKEGHPVHKTPIDLSCPVMEVDFWDAYAYAKWKGRELPTEEEWEKAARGTKGFIYPWGDEFDPKKVNSNADYNQNDPGAKGQVDGFNLWNPVDKVRGDKSPFGIIGMAGNVREWTNTWDTVKKHPIIKGGSYMASDVRLDQHMDADPNGINESIGFRTISRVPPANK